MHLCLLEQCTLQAQLNGDCASGSLLVTESPSK
uniref:Uncharacterized protein n=1 Tax=Anguilla anguilla TaxID=7936 RepID=A0A0E9SSS5_ANGAN